MGQIQERFIHFVEIIGLTKQDIEKRIGVSNGFVGKIVAGKTSFSVDVLENILTAFPTLSPTWLTKGEGDMFLNHKKEPDKPDLEARIKELEKKYEALAKNAGASVV
jgi:transcriptional regulator with XRE-family HTH domain